MGFLARVVALARSHLQTLTIFLGGDADGPVAAVWLEGAGL